MFDVFLEGLAVDQDVVHVNDDEDVDVLDQQPVDALLEASRAIRHAEGQD